MNVKKFLSLRRVQVIAGLLVLGIVVLVGRQILFKTSSLPTYTTTAATKGTLVVSVSASGQIDANNSKAVTTSVTGVVKKVLVKNGEIVKTGQILAEVTLDQQAQQSYTQALSTYQSAQNALASAQIARYTLQASMFTKWDSFKTLAESDSYKDTMSANRNIVDFTVPEREWLAAEAQYKNQQNVVAQAQTSLASAAQSLRQSSPSLTASIDGKVSGMSLQVGQVIGTAESTIAHISTESLPTLTVDLTEADVTKVAIGNKVMITIDSQSDSSFTGKVISIDTTGSVNSGVTSYPAVIAFDTAAPTVFANMSAQATIITNTKSDVVIVPTTAISTLDGVSTVKVLKEKEPVSVTVETGIHSSNETEIITGLSEGDQVITSSKSTSSSTASTKATTSPFSSLGGPAGGFTGRAH